MLIKPKDITLTDQEGVERTYVLSRLDALTGREIVAKYPVANLPKIGDYAISEATMLKLMSFVGVKIEGRDEPLLLNSRDMIRNHIPDWEVLARLEIEQLAYNTSFFSNGLNSASFGTLMEKARPWITQMLTDLSQQSSTADKQPSPS